MLWIEKARAKYLRKFFNSISLVCIEIQINRLYECYLELFLKIREKLSQSIFLDMCPFSNTNKIIFLTGKNKFTYLSYLNCLLSI